jgi:hypothetical protein
LTIAAECHRNAGAQLAAARTATEYGQASLTAKEGLTYIATARAALGFEAAPERSAPGVRKPRGSRVTAGGPTYADSAA